jgi:cysteine desulfurase
MIYADHNATTPVAPRVFEAMRPFFTERYGNPSSVYSFGSQVMHFLEQARSQVAALLGAYPPEIIFTGGGTESNNMAIRGALGLRPERNHIVTSRVEHSSVLRLCQHLEQEGQPVSWIDVDCQGQIDLNQLEQEVTEQTAIVSILWANNETGVISPVEEIGRIARDKGALFHTDAVQAAGKIPINVSRLPVDLLSIAAHKFYGPKGVGALYLRRGKRIRPLIYGGDQERTYRAGTENTAGIVGMAEACRLAIRWLEEGGGEKLAVLRDRFEDAIVNQAAPVQINGDPANRICNTSNLSFERVAGESILLDMDQKGVCASSGSACSSRSVEPSHVLEAMGLDEVRTRGAVRFSFGRGTTDEEINRLIEIVPDVVKRLRRMSLATKGAGG